MTDLQGHLNSDRVKEKDLKLLKMMEGSIDEGICFYILFVLYNKLTS
ncbi:hypothetical protein FIA58_006225 [Flavobacterium jejuense]|uniref:Uncharacterized protein n=1 Tax=Flavobacterium jejuense TaxID=1544455 RepID=A0ABX0IQC8_9FLAO|nr:hypothetical protein [Flavobacterium jejuense]NHN25270.1 hypothetical protein [Flavobacterium jejuense]